VALDLAHGDPLPQDSFCYLSIGVHRIGIDRQ
jgi:hypothetical protein